ncbi:pentapeptide repeat-containing protein [Micromonospora sp. NPDC048898]|uniref:pentapeptide repeat-containing protein n=1 Tax=Micromonospora sp. NPDC048898 TaxID=3364260 RepID=UPI00371CA7A8
MRVEERRLNFSATHLRGADLTGARLDGADFSNANLTGANLFGAQLKNCSFSMAILSEVDLSKANLERSNLLGANLQKSQLFGANLEGAILSRARLQGASLFAAELSWANLLQVRLDNADLHGAKLHRAGLMKARMEGCSLLGAQLTEADLKGARLQRANLEAANFDGANLAGCDLSLAMIKGSSFDGAIINIRQLDSAISPIRDGIQTSTTPLPATEEAARKIGTRSAELRLRRNIQEHFRRIANRVNDLDDIGSWSPLDADRRALASITEAGNRAYHLTPNAPLGAWVLAFSSVVYEWWPSDTEPGYELHEMVEQLRQLLLEGVALTRITSNRDTEYVKGNSTTLRRDRLPPPATQGEAENPRPEFVRSQGEGYRG